MAPELGVRRADGGHEVTLGVVMSDQVRNHLSIGLGGEFGSIPLQPALERYVVLDDAVHDHVDAVGGVEVRVRVLLGHPAVCGPPGVADTGAGRGPLGHGHGAAARLIERIDHAVQRAQVADRANSMDPVSLQDRDAGAVVAAVLELLQPCQQQRTGFPGTNVADDAAHAFGS